MSLSSSTVLEENEEQWDMIIQPKANLLDLKLKEVWRYRDLLLLFVKRDFVAQYKQTILGPLWHLIQPAITTFMFLLVFGRIANIPTDGIPPVLFYLSGITMWNYFAACINSTSNTFIANAGIFGKVYFPRLVLPLSSVASNLVKFGIQLLLLVAVLCYYYLKGFAFQFQIALALLPVLLIVMASLGLGLGIIISSLTTKYRDLNVLVGFAVQLLMYATPVVYPLSFLKGKSYAAWIQWNPLTPIIETFRYSLFGKGTFNAAGLIYSAMVTLIIVVSGLILFNKVEKNFMDTV